MDSHDDELAFFFKLISRLNSFRLSLGCDEKNSSHGLISLVGKR